MTSQYKGSKVGFPIRRSLDQSSFAAPQSLSQRTTSFIASQRQGIHRVPLRHLIALIIDARHAFSVCVRHSARRRPPHPEGHVGRTGHRSKKDQLASRSVRRLCGQAKPTRHRARPCPKAWSIPMLEYAFFTRRFSATPEELGAISSSRCQTTRAAARWPATRNFTLLDELLRRSP